MFVDTACSEKVCDVVDGVQHRVVVGGPARVQHRSSDLRAVDEELVVSEASDVRTRVKHFGLQRGAKGCGRWCVCVFSCLQV